MPKRNNRRKFKKPKNRPIELKSHGTEYAIIVENYGDCRFLVDCDDGIQRIGIVKGSLRNRVRFRVDDYVLLELQDDFNSYSSIVDKNFKHKAIMFVKYFPQEVKFLQSNNHFKILDGKIQNQNDDEFDELIQNDNNSDDEGNTIDIDTQELDDI